MKLNQAARVILVVASAALLSGCWYDDSATVDKKIADAVAKVERAPAALQTPVAPAAPVPGSAKAAVNCGDKVVVNASASGSNPDVNVTIKDCEPAAPTVTQPPPCQVDCVEPTVWPGPRFYNKGPLVRQPAPPVFRERPVVRRQAPPVAATCYVRVDLLERDRVTPYRRAMPLQVTDEEAKRVLSNVILQPGRNLVVVPCDGRREICLTIVSRKDGKAIYTRYITPEWFASHRRNLSRGGVFNPNDPVGFTSKS